jgi:hypothetical protein
MEGRQTEYERTTSLFGTGQVVGITLVVKAHTSEAAERIVRTRL